MDTRELRAEASQQLAGALDRLAEDPDDLLALWLVDVFAPLGADVRARTALLAGARRRFAVVRKQPGLPAGLRALGALELLADLWMQMQQDSYNGSAAGPLAEWLIELCDDADRLAALATERESWIGGWQQVNRSVARACERLAAAALALDPKLDGVRWLYMQKDFCQRVSTSTRRVTGPPGPRPSPAQRLEELRALIRRFEKERKGSDLSLQMDLVQPDSMAIVDALIVGLSSSSPYAAACCVEVLGRAKVGKRRILAAFIELLDECKPHMVDAVAMAIHYELRGDAVLAFEALERAARRLVARLTKRTEKAYHHRWALTTFLDLSRFCKGARRVFARESILSLLAKFERMPEWKQTCLHEFRYEAPTALARLGVKVPRWYPS